MKTAINVLIVALGVTAAIVTIVAFLNGSLPRRRAWLIVGLAVALGTIVGLVALNRERIEVPPSEQADSSTASNRLRNSGDDELKGTGSDPSQSGGAESALSLSRLIAALEGRDLTGLQKSQLVRRLRGQRVHWKVIVHDVQRSFEADPKSDLLVAVSPPPQGDEILPDIIVASFSYRSEPDLAPLEAGDEILVDGTLDFTELGGRYSPILKESHLLTYQKGVKK